MQTKLTIDDTKALDLLLDRGASVAGAPHAASFVNVVGRADAVSPHRVHAVQKMLHLLDAFTAEEPSTDLASRTMDHIASVAMSASAKRRHLPARGLSFGPSANNHVS